MRFSRMLVILFLGGGVALLGGMFWQAGLQGFCESLSAIGFWVIPFLALDSIPQGLHTMGWAACFQPQAPRPCWWQLFLIRLAGTAINQVTPTASVGGEVVRVLLLEPFMPRTQAIAPVVIGKASVTIAQMIYLSFGTLYLMWRAPLPPALQWTLSLTIALISCGLFGFVLCQRYGLLSTLVHHLHYLGIYPQRFQRLAQRLAGLDAQLMAYYTTSRRRFLRSLCLHGLGFACDGGKTYIMLRLLLGSQAPGMAEAWMVAVAVGALDQMFFFVPGRVGTLEGVRFTVLSLLGVAHIYGFAFGLIARLEHLVWSGLGLAAYALCMRCPWARHPKRVTPYTPASLPTQH